MSNQIKASDRVYRRLADQIIHEIIEGKRRPGDRLPTVRQLAQQTGHSLGTIKHVYDVLEQEGHIVKEQGRGTYVKETAVVPTGDKARAMEAIDALLDQMRALSFTWQETRIFLDLKLREREQDQGVVRIGAVDCNPEALSMMREQILALPHVEVESYLLDDVLGAPRFVPQTDIVVTTATHAGDLAQKMDAGEGPVRLVMGLGTETAVALASIPAVTKVAVICKSGRFAQIILKACEKYCRLERPVQVAFFGDTDAVAKAVRENDLLILAPNYHLFSSRQEDALIEHSGKQVISYRYQVEKGSMVYLENLTHSFLHQKNIGIQGYF